MSLSERLAGPFNVEMTIEPISIKISDAIMNFQESGFQVNWLHPSLFEVPFSVGNMDRQWPLKNVRTLVSDLVQLQLSVLSNFLNLTNSDMWQQINN